VTASGTRFGGDLSRLLAPRPPQSVAGGGETKRPLVRSWSKNFDGADPSVTQLTYAPCDGPYHYF